MFRSLRRWLDTLPYTDPIQRGQAWLVQIMLLITLAACVLGIPVALVTAASAEAILMPLTIYPLLLVTNSGALLLLRRGRFSWAVYSAGTGMVLGISISLMALGLSQSETVLTAYAIPILMVGLAIGRRGLLSMLGLTTALVSLIAVLQIVAPQLVGFLDTGSPSPIGVALTFAMLVGVLALMLDQFGTSLRGALTATQLREHELEELRASLEQTVRDRTASLEMAVTEMERREQRLTLTLEELQASRETIRELSAPVLPVLPQVLVAPLVGALDEQRIGAFADNLLHTVERERARHVILDITGVPLVDTQVAQTLLRAADSVRLLGGQALLVGVRPEVAQTLVSLGVDLSRLPTFSSLREAVADLAARASQ